MDYLTPFIMSGSHSALSSLQKPAVNLTCANETPRKEVLLDKPTVTQLLKIFWHLMESLTFIIVLTKERNTNLNHEPHKFNPYFLLSILTAFYHLRVYPYHTVDFPTKFLRILHYLPVRAIHNACCHLKLQCAVFIVRVGTFTRSWVSGITDRC
jgi:hypothetical protein